MKKVKTFLCDPFLSYTVILRLTVTITNAIEI